MNNKRRHLEDIRIRTSMQGITASPMDTHAIKQNGWREHGILVIDVNHGSLTSAERNFIENIGTKFYGRRPTNGR